MYYLIDGYNVFFKAHSDSAFVQEREDFIEYMHAHMERLGLYGALILDYAHDLASSHPTRIHSKHLECIYAPSGLDADNYILEFLFNRTDHKQLIVVTSDAQLSRSVKELGTKTLTSEAFLHKLSTKKSKPVEKPTSTESPKRMQHLLRVFTEKLREETED